MTLDLTREEQTLLSEILTDAWHDLRAEIYKTDRSAYKRALKDQAHLLGDLLERVKRETAPAPAG